MDNAKNTSNASVSQGAYSCTCSYCKAAEGLYRDREADTPHMYFGERLPKETKWAQPIVPPQRKRLGIFKLVEAYIADLLNDLAAVVATNHYTKEITRNVMTTFGQSDAVIFVQTQKDGSLKYLYYAGSLWTKPRNAVKAYYALKGAGLNVVVGEDAVQLRWKQAMQATKAFDIPVYLSTPAPFGTKDEQYLRWVAEGFKGNRNEDY